MKTRPSFIPRGVFRAWCGVSSINKYFRVGDMLPASYIQKCARDGRPIRSVMVDGSRKYRPIDVIARASADGLATTSSEVVELSQNILALRNELARLSRAVENGRARRDKIISQEMCAVLTDKALLTEPEIVKAKSRIDNESGIYFLIKEDRVVYVGQSVQVLGRVFEHKRNGVDFDGFSYIHCDEKQLDIIESLYIHMLRPELNGKLRDGYSMHAPIKLSDIVKLSGSQ